MTYQHKQEKSSYLGPYLAGHQPRIMIEEILSELLRARTKFPDQTIWITLAALTEEVGELNQAVLHLNFEKPIDPARIYDEAVQVAVMAIRVALDCSYTP